MSTSDPSAPSGATLANRLLRVGAVMLACLQFAVLAACSSADEDLERFIDQTKREGGGRVEPLPEVKPYETFAYSAASLRSPFTPNGPSGGSAYLRPDPKRNREFLEQYSLDTLKMVGTLKLSNSTFGLVETKDGLVHRVIVGNYVGQNDGRITDITPSKILVREIIPDGTGGYVERPAELPLNN